MGYARLQGERFGVKSGFVRFPLRVPEGGVGTFAGRLFLLPVCHLDLRALWRRVVQMEQVICD